MVESNGNSNGNTIQPLENSSQMHDGIPNESSQPSDQSRSANSGDATLNRSPQNQTNPAYNFVQGAANPGEPFVQSFPPGQANPEYKFLPVCRKPTYLDLQSPQNNRRQTVPAFQYPQRFPNIYNTYMIPQYPTYNSQMLGIQGNMNLPNTHAPPPRNMWTENNSQADYTNYQIRNANQSYPSLQPYNQGINNNPRVIPPKNYSSSNVTRNDPQFWQLKGSKSLELRGGKILLGCACKKTNGLQDNCFRSRCRTMNVNPSLYPVFGVNNNTPNQGGDNYMAGYLQPQYPEKAPQFAYNYPLLNPQVAGNMNNYPASVIYPQNNFSYVPQYYVPQ